MHSGCLPHIRYCVLEDLTGGTGVPIRTGLIRAGGRPNQRAQSPSPACGSPVSGHHSDGRICGLVGAYLLTILIWGVLLLTVGKRMRTRTEAPPKQLELKPVTTQLQSLKSPGTPGSARSWLKNKIKKTPQDSAVGSPQSPVVQSPGSFDQKVLDTDRERAQADMERLYAAVMDHDKKKSYSQVSSVDGHELDDRRPSRINTNQESSPYSNPSSPIKAIYPPNYHNGPPTAPLPRDRLRDQPPASPRSILSKKSQMSTTSTGTRSTRFNLKNLRISGPMQKYPGNNNHDDEEARTPLSPRFYGDPGAPPSPPTQQHSPTTPGTIEEAYENLDEVQPLPRPAPQRLNSAYAESPTAATPTSAVTVRSTNTSATSLPLRGYAEELRSPGLKTTVVDRRVERLGAKTPGTGVPYTPYSPYMPFTPVTPVTPHLVTRKDMKREKKDRKMGRMRNLDELVQSPKEIFGDAY
ncbi:hypothetical protein P154DRAFT_543757 [Amniculicola lignicola CBS 123094]|uniref:Uncharacterized protein n=1 Tax=Amniculicola lignicola CBS 123094 TaxID=1392246 RepID=A0A6A5WP63_9PLEO|nr:hypothetical protein P154DRAFT_543757 [Amniculicola lignicola CBS 123094]